MSSQPLVLAVDDEVGILRLLKLELTPQGFRVVTAPNGQAALRAVEEQKPDLVLLDIVMPDMTGLEVMRKLRERSSVPIIFLSAKNTDADKVSGLDLGADDYIPKPFNPEEVSARVRAVLRRSLGANRSQDVLQVADVEIDLDRRLVRKQGRIITLTRTEWLLLQVLATNAGRVMLNAELLSKVWGPEYRNDLQYLRVWISRLRRKLEADHAKPALIRTFHGIGYMFDASTLATAA
ncbi:MAG: response regulator transcription factor [Dehalococcoidia bacterium]|nr:response regulator transcription factor [Dehalococcoidia bacterium]